MKNSEFLQPFFTLIDNQIVATCQSRANEVIDIINQLALVNKQLTDDIQASEIDNRPQDFLKISKDYQSRKISLLSQTFAEKNTPLFTLALRGLYNSFDLMLKELPNHLREEQDRERFYTTAQNGRIIRLLKFFKLTFYKISTIPLLIANGFLKLFRKKPRHIPYWKYRLPLRLLTEHFLKTVVIKGIDVEISQFSKELVLILKSSLDKEQHANQLLIDVSMPTTKIQLPDVSFDLEDELDQILNLKASFSSNIKTQYQLFEDEFAKLQKITGTLERPTTFVRFHNRKRRQLHYAKLVERTNVGWGNTAFGLMEDWKIDQELFKLVLQIKIDLYKLKVIFENNKEVLLAYLKDGLQAMEAIKIRLMKQLSDPKTDPSKVIRLELNALDHNLVQPYINPALQKILSQDFISGINAFELKIDDFVVEVAEKRWLTKLTSYNQPLRSSDLDSFSPHELISYKYLPELKEACALIKSKNTRQVEMLNQDIGNLASVISFNLNTILESKEIEDIKKQAPKLMQEGIDRSRNKMIGIMESLVGHNKEILDKFDNIVNRFADATLELTNNENAFDLRIIVTKARAIQRTVDVKNYLQSKAKFFYTRSSSTYKHQRESFDRFIVPWKRRFGILDSGKLIATELSDFLSEAINKINSLPVVYQQLYRIRPLTEMNLFTGRYNELQRLDKAFKSWKEGKYAPTVVVGEKWTGHTSLINYFMDKKTKGTRLIYENRQENIWSAEDFILTWQIILKNPELDSIDSIIDHINTSHKNTIIIIENIQNYYLRTIKGFEALNLFVKLISKTYTNVFWLCTANVYAWEYLNKTIEISGYFGYHIHMTSFSDDELRLLIMKKNNISGYKIVFEAGQKNLENKKFIALDAEEKQAFLQNQFFKRLNEFARGNISLALSYWLLSTKTISDDSIEISNFTSPDFSFITLLNAEKVFLIYLLIMHDGLSLDQLAIVLNKPVEKLHLLVIMLLDDGLLVERKGWYEVNPLIYRHCINMLKSKNLIY